MNQKLFDQLNGMLAEANEVIQQYAAELVKPNKAAYAMIWSSDAVTAAARQDILGVLLKQVSDGILNERQDIHTYLIHRATRDYSPASSSRMRDLVEHEVHYQRLAIADRFKTN